jgi:hypothetical protein
MLNGQSKSLTQQLRQLGEVRPMRRASSRVSRFGRRAVRRSDTSEIGGEAECAACARNDVDDAKPAIKRGSYLGPLLASFFLISGLSYKTTFNSELRISSFPLYSI